jgi:hypothetical protein
MPGLLILGGQLMSRVRKLTLPPTIQLQEEKPQNTENELYEGMVVQSVTDIIPRNEASYSKEEIKNHNGPDEPAEENINPSQLHHSHYEEVQD